jgi:uncharacterized membrane protein
VLLSFFGWAFEVGVMLVQTGRFHNQGFITLPFCPIYGCCLIIAYFLLGTPDHGRGILRTARQKSTRYPLYFLFAFLIPSLAELLVGLSFSSGLQVTLWSYSSLPMNLYGFVSLPISLAWATLIFLFMKYAFLPIKNAVGKILKPFASALALALLFILLTDFSLNLAYAIYR